MAIAAVLVVSGLILNIALWTFLGRRRAQKAGPAFKAEVQDLVGGPVLNVSGVRWAGAVSDEALDEWGRGLRRFIGRSSGERSGPTDSLSPPSADWYVLAESNRALHVLEMEMNPRRDHWSPTDEVMRLSADGLRVTRRPGFLTTRVDIVTGWGKCLSFEMARDPIGSAGRFAKHLVERFSATAGEEVPGSGSLDPPILDGLEKATAELNLRGGLPDGEGFSQSFTPPLPMSWPPETDRRLAVYSYASRMDFERLRDAVWTFQPHARVVFDPHGQDEPEYQRLAADIGEGDPQGVRPRTPAEVAISQRGGEATARLLRHVAHGTGSGIELAIGESYLLWRSSNGVIARSLRAQHEDFFAALDRFDSVWAFATDLHGPTSKVDHAGAAHGADRGLCPKCALPNDPSRTLCATCGARLHEA